MDEGLENADAARVALSLQAFQHGLTVVQAVRDDPVAYLVFEGIKLCAFPRTRRCLGCATQILPNGIPRNAGFGRNGPDRMPLGRQFTNSMHSCTPEHRHLLADNGSTKSMPDSGVGQ